MGKTKKTNIDATSKPSPKPNGVAKTSSIPSPLSAASPAAPGMTAPGKIDSAPAKPFAAKPAPAAAAKKAVKRAAPAAKGSKKPASISSDDIALRAYFISEKRRAHGLPGDDRHDWIEAERQLRAELAKPARAKRSA